MRLDLLLTNANVVTMDQRHPRATQVGLWRGLIVGIDGDVAGLASERTVDLGGATVVPGLIDSHNHMAMFGRRLAEIDAGACRSLDELIRAVRERARELPDDEWITGSGYDQSLLGGHPRRADLDAAAGGRKVLLIHRTSHMLVASTAVFDVLGAMEPAYPDPAGGYVERATDGRPTGLVVEQAMAPFKQLLKPVPLDDLVADLRRASDRYLAEGLTSVVEAGIGESPIVGSSPLEAAAYQRAVESGDLRVRVQLMVAMENLHPISGAPVDGTTLGLDLGIRTGLGGPRLSLGPVKMFTDGALTSRTAALTERFCGHDHTGILQYPPEHVIEVAVAAHVAGWQLAIHAIGDRAMDIALDAIEAAQRSRRRPDARHRIEHASVIRPGQLDRFMDLGVIPSPQGRFIYEIGDSVADALGDRRLAWTYRHASLLARGLIVPAGSDRPVVAGAPLPAIQAMVERRTAAGRDFGRAEAISAEEALRSYTVHSAYAQFADRDRGRIRPGFLADLTVLDRDITTCDVAEIGSTAVLATIVNGVAEYDAAGWFRLGRVS